MWLLFDFGCFLVFGYLGWFLSFWNLGWISVLELVFDLGLEFLFRA